MEREAAAYVRALETRSLALERAQLALDDAVTMQRGAQSGW